MKCRLHGLERRTHSNSNTNRRPVSSQIQDMQHQSSRRVRAQLSAEEVSFGEPYMLTPVDNSIPPTTITHHEERLESGEHESESIESAVPASQSSIARDPTLATAGT